MRSSTVAVEEPAFHNVLYKEPHLTRKKLLREAHPEVDQLMGPDVRTFYCVVGVVALQCAMAYALRDSSFWMVLLGAYVVGAVADHSLWALIHDCSHNLVFKSTWANRLLAMVANFPIWYPAAMSFRVYHLMHHRYQGQVDLDADMPAPIELKLIGQSTLGKTLWMLFYAFFQTIRISQKNLVIVDRWIVLNWITQVSFLAGAWYVSPMCFLYFFMSGSFAVGLHPVGGRWIQEHYTTSDDNQETFSYYGWMNWLAFNVGYHNEHHDFMYVPWTRLPELRKLAPEFYDHLHYHTSWGLLLLRFLLDRNLGLRSRVARPPLDQQEGIAPVGILAKGVPLPSSAYKDEKVSASAADAAAPVAPNVSPARPTRASARRASTH